MAAPTMSMETLLPTYPDPSAVDFCHELLLGRPFYTQTIYSLLEFVFFVGHWARCRNAPPPAPPPWSCRGARAKACVTENSSVMMKAVWLSFLWLEAVTYSVSQGFLPGQAHQKGRQTPLRKAYPFSSSSQHTLECFLWCVLHQRCSVHHAIYSAKLQWLSHSVGTMTL